jgi:8-hydroxy-5-deazaflavin:NADPH oxidoreductase
MADTATILSIGILGGTGKEGVGLAKRWAVKGYKVIIGSRDAEKAIARAAELNAELGDDYLTGMANSDTALKADVVVLSVPYAAHRATLESLKEQLLGKVLIDLTVPIVPPKIRTVTLPEGQSAAMEAQSFLGDRVKVVAAFQNVSAQYLSDLNHVVDCDVLVCGNDLEAKKTVIELVKATGMRGIDAGLLPNAIAVESLTPVLRYINKTYNVKDAGIRITGI